MVVTSHPFFGSSSLLLANDGSGGFIETPFSGTASGITFFDMDGVGGDGAV